MLRPDHLESDTLFKAMVERLMFFGQLFAFVASHPEIDDTETAEMIQAKQFILREEYLMFHNLKPMRAAEAEQVLRGAFPA